jgi:ABC-type nitrate/sulfonate/bicarbonate transport system substrate-binding protein
MRKRSIAHGCILATSLVGVLALATACGGAGDDAAAGSGGSGPMTVKVAVAQAPSMTQLPFWIATHEGFAEKNNVTLNLEGAGFNVAVQGTVSGSYQFNSQPSPSIQAALSGAPLVVTAVGANHILGAIYTKPGVTSAAQLSGKAIVGNGNTLTQLIIGHWLTDHGVTPTSVTQPSGDSVPQLLAGTATAALVSQPSEVALNGKGYTNLGDLSKYQLAYSGVATTKKYADAHPEVVKAVNGAYCDAVSFMLDPANIDKVAADAVTYFNLGVSAGDGDIKTSVQSALKNFSPCTLTDDQITTDVNTVAEAAKMPAPKDSSVYIADSAKGVSP